MSARLFTSLLLAGALLVGVGCGEDKGESTRGSWATSVQVVNDSAVMNFHKNYLVTHVSGEIGSKGIPSVISVGDEITVGDTSMHVRLIRVIEWLRDSDASDHKRGDIYCSIAESHQDFPDGREIDRVWIYVEHCTPIKW